MNCFSEHYLEITRGGGETWRWKTCSLIFAPLSTILVLFSSMRTYDMGQSILDSSPHHYLLRTLEQLYYTIMHVCSVAVYFPTLHDPMESSLPGPLSMQFPWQEYLWEWVAISSSRDLSNLGIESTSSASNTLAGRFFTTETHGKPNTQLYWLANKWQVVGLAVFWFYKNYKIEYGSIGLCLTGD